MSTLTEDMQVASVFENLVPTHVDALCSEHSLLLRNTSRETSQLAVRSYHAVAGDCWGKWITVEDLPDSPISAGADRMR